MGSRQLVDALTAIVQAANEQPHVPIAILLKHGEMTLLTTTGLEHQGTLDRLIADMLALDPDTTVEKL